MEALYPYNIYIEKELVGSVSAHTKWHAIELAYNKLCVSKPDRSKYDAKKKTAKP